MASARHHSCFQIAAMRNQLTTIDRERLCATTGGGLKGEQLKMADYMLTFARKVIAGKSKVKGEELKELQQVLGAAVHRKWYE
jgi:hypothetical protein